MASTGAVSGVSTRLSSSPQSTTRRAILLATAAGRDASDGRTAREMPSNKGGRRVYEPQAERRSAGAPELCPSSPATTTERHQSASDFQADSTRLGSQPVATLRLVADCVSTCRRPCVGLPVFVCLLRLVRSFLGASTLWCRPDGTCRSPRLVVAPTPEPSHRCRSRLGHRIGGIRFFATPIPTPSPETADMAFGDGVRNATTAITVGQVHHHVVKSEVVLRCPSHSPLADFVKNLRKGNEPTQRQNRARLFYSNSNRISSLKVFKADSSSHWTPSSSNNEYPISRANGGKKSGPSESRSEPAVRKPFQRSQRSRQAP